MEYQIDLGLTLPHSVFLSMYLHMIDQNLNFHAKIFNFDQTYLNTAYRPKNKDCGKIKPN